ncbi:MAG: maltose O-acetyltransferase [Mycobacteriales bacterium]
MGEMKDRMLRGDLYRLGGDPDLRADLDRCASLVRDYNDTRGADQARRPEILAKLLDGVGEFTFVLPPIHLNYGYQTTIGSRTFINVGVVILDVARVSIGDDVRIGPNVQLLTPTHPLDPAERRTGLQSGEPISIGDGAWLGGGVIVCPGITIGADSVIGAGSVVTADVPARVLAAGNPCRVIRPL